MNDFDPIEIGIAINSPEVAQQAANVEASLKGLDSAVEKTEAKFKQMNASNAAAAAKGQQIANQVVQQKRSFDGLGNSINQITRELPAFTFSAQTGFLAISNNIPILADEINRLRVANQDLVASGGKAVPIWQQVAKSFLSFNTVMSVGITLLTIFGRQIGDYIIALFKGKEALDDMKLSQDAVNSAYKSTEYTKVIKDLFELNSLIKLAKKGTIDKKDALDKYNETLGKVAGKTDDLKIAEQNVIDKAPAYIQSMLFKIAAMESAKEAAIKLAESQKLINELEDEKIKIEKKPKPKEVAGGFNPTSPGSVNYQSLENAKDLREINKEISEIGKKQDGIVSKGQNVVDKLLAKAAEIAKAAGLKFNPEDEKKEITAKVNEYQSLLDKITEIDKEYTRKSFTKDQEELQALADKFQKIRSLVEKFNANPKNKAQLIDLTGFNALEQSATKDVVFRQDTSKITTQLEQEKTVFAAYEALKTKVGVAEADKRYQLLLGGFASYSEKLQAEYNKLQESLKGKEKTGAETERLELFKALLNKEKEAQKINDENRFAAAFNSAITFNEKIKAIEVDYQNRKAELNKITDETIKTNKLAILEQQKNDALNSAKEEAYQTLEIFQNLSDALLGITRRQLDSKIASLKEYLATANGLTPEQKESVQKEITNLEGIKGNNQFQIAQNLLLQKEKEIREQIAIKQAKGTENVDKEIEALAKVQLQLLELKDTRLQQLATDFYDIGSSLSQLGSSLAGIDAGLSDTISTMGELSSIGGDVLNAFATFKTDPIGAIGSAISAIGGLFSLGAKARESERKAREEMKKWQQEIFESQLAYNSEFRKRLSAEIKLNDLYKSRVDNIKEEIEANKTKLSSIVKDYEAAFKKLLNAQTVVDKQTEKYGGFLGIGRKTRVKEITKSVAEILGIGKFIEKEITRTIGGIKFTQKLKIFEPGQVELTDEIFDKLDKLNAEKPLTGDAKLAYEQLKKLRDEYGSIEEAQRQLEIQLKNAVTGTTALAIADSILQGVAQGKKTFADFAQDIEKFLRDAILAGLSAKIIEPEMQKLQDLLYGFLGDGILTEDEKKAFQDMYIRIAEQANEYLDLINQAGIDIGGTSANTANNLEGAVKGITAQQADLLAGQFGGLRLTQLQTNVLLERIELNQGAKMSQSVQLQKQIEFNTRRTADNTDRIPEMATTLKDIKDSLTDKSGRANGL